MTSSWFNTPQRLDALRTQFLAWVGTPFLPNSCQRGMRGGVSCQKLSAAIYRGAGFVDIDPPEVSMSHARFSRESLVEPWMDKREEFERIPLIPGETIILTGDLLGFRIGGAVHHLGVAAGQANFFHVIEGQAAQLAWLTDPTWRKRLAAIWRPKP